MKRRNALVVAASVPLALAIVLALILMGTFTPASLGTFGDEPTDLPGDGNPEPDEESLTVAEHTHEHVHHVHQNPNATANHTHELHEHLHELDLHHGEETNE